MFTPLPLSSQFAFLSVCLKKACPLAGDGVPDCRDKSGVKVHSAVGSEKG